MYCPACGAAVKQPARRKNKNTTVLLAISLRWWTWLYTYKRDTWKFWLGLGIGVVSVGLIFAYIINVFAYAINVVGLATSGSLNKPQLVGNISGMDYLGHSRLDCWLWHMGVGDSERRRQEW